MHMTLPSNSHREEGYWFFGGGGAVWELDTCASTLVGESTSRNGKSLFPHTLSCIGVPDGFSTYLTTIIFCTGSQLSGEQYCTKLQRPSCGVRISEWNHPHAHGQQQCRPADGWPHQGTNTQTRQSSRNKSEAKNLISQYYWPFSTTFECRWWTDWISLTWSVVIWVQWVMMVWCVSGVWSHREC